MTTTATATPASPAAPPIAATLPYAGPSTLPAKPPRLASLDAFRGATIVGMILVNNPGSWAPGMRYAPLDHAPWHGCTPTDWIFPFFLFIVGVAIPFSQAKRRDTAANAARSDGAMILSILRRSAILFGLGIFLALIPYSATTGIMSWSTVRIPGVLQRIAICYGVVAIFSLFVNWRAMVAAGLGLMLVYFLLMRFVPAPGFEAGDWSKEGNLAHYIDKTIFGARAYGRYADPEGILSTLPAIGTVICGWLVGMWLRTNRTAAEKAAAVFAFGVIGIVLGLILDAALMPINKMIWTPSYVVYTAGLACLGLGLCYWFIDILGYRRWATPLVACGMNAITIFVLAGVVGRLMLTRAIEGKAIKSWLYDTLFVPMFASPLNASLAWAIVFVAMFVGIAAVMHRMRWYVKV